jgi:hypothetical protein
MTIPQYGDWNKDTEMIRLLVRSFRNLNMNVIFVAARQDKDDDKKRIFYKPALPGKLADEVQGFLDFVGLYVSSPASDDGTIRRRLYLAPGPQYQAKNRFRGFKANYIDDPTMQSILDVDKL